MRPTQAIRFAQSVLRENQNELEFDVEVAAAERDSIAEAFRSLGCRVRVVQHKPWLRIRRDVAADE
jgi:hypothetical protein